MAYAVYHMEKGNSSSGGIGNHIDRTEGKEHSYLQADPARKHLNIHFDVHEKRNEISLNEAIEKRIVEGYKGEKAIRKDAVKYCTHVLTGSHEKMKEIFADKEKSKEWIKDNYKFLAKEFGKENIVRFTLHLDEKTPHLHAVTIPLTSDGRLSAKEIIGNKQSMKNFQTRYAAEMEKYGLQRGIENTGITHENAQDYYSRITEAEKEAVSSQMTAQKNLLGVYTAESVQKLESSLKSANLALKMKDYELKKNEERLRFSSQGKSRAEKNEQTALIQKRELISKSLNEKENFKKIILDPERTERVRYNLLEEKKQNEEKREQNKGRGFSR
jgi:hypothetical protein